MGIKQFYTQFKALVWKNAVLKIRHIFVLVLEIAIPVLILLALGAIKEVAKPSFSRENIPTTMYVNDDLSTMYNPPYGIGCTDSNLVWRCAEAWPCDPVTDINTRCQPLKIAVAPKHHSNAGAAQAALDMVTMMNSNSTYPGAFRHQTFTYFSSESSFLDAFSGSKSLYSYDPSIPIYSSAVIFDEGYPNWEYTVRMNKTYFKYNEQMTTLTSNAQPDMDIAARSNKEGNFGTPYNKKYLYSGTLTLMEVVNSFISTTTCRNQGTCSGTEEVKFRTQGIADFPHPESTSTGFWSAIGGVFGLLMIISLLYPLANVIKTLVMEKESKIREGMMMMALRGDVLWVSWAFNFFCLFLPLSIILSFVGKALFTYSDGRMIFIYFFLFFVSSTAYCIFISSFFSKARTASIVGCMLFFGGFFIYVGLGSTAPKASLMAACLHPAAAFTYGTLAFVEYEDAQIGVTNFTYNVTQSYSITFKDCLDMMVIDTIYLSVLAWYFNSIWPSEFGTHKPWYFVFLPKYWWSVICSIIGCFSSDLRKKYAKAFDKLDPRTHDSDSGIELTSYVEPVAESFSSLVGKKTCVEINNLYKEFDTNTGKKVAVNNLNLTMYPGQITALLGHNGAGKSTTIAMLTGLIAPDGGTAIIEGFDINEDMEEIRHNLGVCPQHDILFPDLTVEEHLKMFASFKGTESSNIKEEVDKMIASVGLTEKRHVFSSQLSGGQKRKLSCAIAFIGGSRVIFLDEPTSGMDPYSRRFTWNVIRQHREGRVIILTTHFMDEADLLGDRIAIMGDGNLRCCGSSLYLKNIFGVGYNMTIEKTDAISFDSTKMESTIHSFVPEAKLLTDVGTEITFQLPFSSSGQFKALFENIDANDQSLKVQSYGMSVTTLEEVFIKVARGTETNQKAEAGRQLLNSNEVSNGEPILADKADPEVSGSACAVDLESNHDKKFGDKGEPLFAFERVDDSNVIKYTLIHLYAMMYKRYLYFIRDTKAWIFQYVLPVIFLLGGMLIMMYTYPDQYQPLKPLEASMYNSNVHSGPTLPTVYTNFSGVSSFCYPTKFDSYRPNPALGYCTDKFAGQSSVIDMITDATDLGMTGLTDANCIRNVSQYLFDHRKDHEASQIGAYSFTNISYSAPGGHISELQHIIHSNYTAAHGAPLYSALLVDGIVRYFKPSASVKVNLYPLPLTRKQSTVFDNYNVDLVVTFLLLAISFLPAGLASYVVREREVKAKYQQLVSGVSVPAYWIATWLWDNLTMQVTIWMFIILITSFPKTEALADKSSGALGATFGLLILFGGAITGFTYILSIFFASPATAQVVLIFVIFILGFALSIVGIVLRILPDTHDNYMDTIRWVLCLFPPFALGDGLHNLALRDVWSINELGATKKYDVHAMEITGVNFIMLAWECVVYLGLTIAYEYLKEVPSIRALLFPEGTLPEVDKKLKDDDVIAEEVKIADRANDDQSTIIMRDAKKMYPGGKFAVRGMSLGIPNGECFGLLGINGAGKSTSLAMLSGELQPSSGELFLSGKNLLTDVHTCRRKIGFCPQFDALLELLTAREHLEMYARIKGIVERDIPRVVDNKIKELGLTEYADRAAGTYSGGNKRKLSVAIAMIGEPSIVFLDEPSTGMDPVARRFMWEVISDIVTKREKCSMILTTHSMEECEALCTRIGIMVGGVLRCLGPAQRLRSKYGMGYQIEIGMMIPDQKDITSIVENMANMLGKKAQGSTEPINDFQMNKSELLHVFKICNHSQWSDRISLTESGCDLEASLQNYSSVDARHVASWWILEDTCDKICNFMLTNFEGYTIRERQVLKIRIEIPKVTSAGVTRKLSGLFGLIEENRQALKIQEYSIAQTSLEQIFNYFASQQEEEVGHAAGLQ